MKIVFVLAIFFHADGKIDYKVAPVEDTVEVCNVRAEEAALATVLESKGKLKDVKTWCFEYTPRIAT